MLDRVSSNLIAAREHLLNQVDAPARTVELVAEQDIGRASRCAKAAMGAGPQNLFRFGSVGIGELLGREVGLHGSAPFDRAARIEDTARVETLLDPDGERRKGLRLRLEDRNRAAQCRRALD